MACIAIKWSIVFLVTGDTPAHSQGTYLAHGAHDLHLAVTFGAIQAGFDVPLVGKVHVLRQVMHFDPGNRLFVVPVFGQFLHFRPFRRSGLVAGHALFHGRHAGADGAIRVFMAESTVQADLRHMDVMGKSDGLLGRLFEMMPVKTQSRYKKNEQSKICIEYQAQNSVLHRYLLIAKGVRCNRFIGNRLSLSFLKQVLGHGSRLSVV